MCYQSVTSSFGNYSFPCYSDRFKDVLDRALRDKQLNYYTNTSLSLQKPQKTSQKLCFIQIRSLGIGAFSSVYMVSEQKTGTIYAMKVISKSVQIKQKESLLQQIKVHLQLNHPNIISLYHIYNQEGCLRLIMEYAQCNLMTILKHKGRFSQKEASQVIAQVLQGIKYIHSREITHRDIKLENILLVNGVVKICDFGLAKKSKQFQSQDLVGTIDYLSPQIIREKRYTHKTDIWAVGVILWELINGSSTFLKQSKDSEKYVQLINMDTDAITYKCSCQLQRFFKRIFTKEIYRAEAQQLLYENFITDNSINESMDLYM